MGEIIQLKPNNNIIWKEILIEISKSNSSLNQWNE